MLNTWKSLTFFWKLVIGFILIFVLFWATDRLHGGWASIKKNLYDKNEAATMAEVQELKAANEKIRLENAALKQQFTDSEKRALEAETKNQIFEARIEQLGGQAIAEQLKTEKVLEELKREEAITNQPVDNRTRCERTRTKLLERGIQSAANINCDQYSR
jgi:hypothetical protein